MKETLTLNLKEQKRLMVVSAVGEGRLEAGEAAVGLGLSRHAGPGQPPRRVQAGSAGRAPAPPRLCAPGPARPIMGLPWKPW